MSILADPSAADRANSSREGMTDGELHEIELRLGRVPPGPWRAIEGSGPMAGRRFINLGPASSGGGEIEATGATRADCEFIAHAREDVPRLLTEIRRLNAILRGADIDVDVD